MFLEAITRTVTFERATEHVRRAARSVRVQGDRTRRRKLVNAIPRKCELDRLIDERSGFARLPIGTINEVAAAVAFAQRELERRRNWDWPEDKLYRPIILQPERYEDAPPLFDLALSDEALQIATDYLGEVPILVKLKLWWTPVNNELKSSQLYHRDGLNWLQRQAKFLFNMIDIDDGSGPFTFLPADVSLRVSETLGTLKIQERLGDEVVYRHARPADAIPLVGPAGTGAVVDSSRCFHFGARARRSERLMLMFSYMNAVDAPPDYGSLRRSAAFAERFGEDPLRELAMPRPE